MRVAVLSANLGAGGYDVAAQWPQLVAPAGVEIAVHRFTDENMPPRPLAMTSRLMCGIPKWFPFDYAPTADVAIWMDASVVPAPTAVTWWLDKLGHLDIALFKHPERRTVRDEYDFMKRRMARPGETYLNSRYRGEDLDGMMARIDARHWGNLQLYASTAFACARSDQMIRALRDVFLWKARHLLHDQLALSFALAEHASDVYAGEIDENYLKCEALTFSRTGKRRSA